MLALSALAERLRPTSEFLVSLQPPSVRKVAGQMHLAFLAVLVVVLQWPDTSLVLDFIRGFKVVGNIPNCGVYGQVGDPHVSEEDILEGAWDAALKLRRKAQKPTEYDEHILRATQDDVDKGFAEEIISWETFCSRHGPNTFRCIRRFPVIQASGKVRPCDDGDEGGHTSLTYDNNKLALCTALQPARHVSALHHEAAQQSVCLSDLNDAILTGGEDWPDAYRFNYPIQAGSAPVGCGPVLPPGLADRGSGGIQRPVVWA